MKNILLIVGGLLFLLGIAGGTANAQGTVVGHIFAEVTDNNPSTESFPMSFGRFSPGDMGGSITIDPSGSVVVLSSVVPADNGIKPAIFSVSGQNDATFSVTLPSGPTTLSNRNGKDTMRITGWTVSEQKQGRNTLDFGGMQTIAVGATLEVGAMNTHSEGTYSGTYTITFDYN